MSTQSHHFISTKIYALVFLSLLFLTVATVYTAKFVDLGGYNLTLAMFIALVKAVLVVLLFMGLLWDKERISSFAFGFSVVFFAIFVALCMIDIVGRDKIVKTDGLFSDGYAPKVEGVTGSTSDREHFMTIGELIELRRQLAAGEKPTLNLSK